VINIIIYILNIITFIIIECLKKAYYYSILLFVWIFKIEGNCKKNIITIIIIIIVKIFFWKRYYCRPTCLAGCRPLGLRAPGAWASKSGSAWHGVCQALDARCHRVKISQGVGWQKALLDSSYGVAACVTVGKIGRVCVRQHTTASAAVCWREWRLGRGLSKAWWNSAGMTQWDCGEFGSTGELLFFKVFFNLNLVATCLYIY